VTPDGDEVVEVDCPAIVTVSNELGDPRYPTAAKKLAARRMKPTVVAVEDLALPAEQVQPRATLTRQFVPTIQGNCEFIAGDTAAALGDRLIERLREDGAIQ
jgi:electron transfer flavoprotein beta subunit